MPKLNLPRTNLELLTSAWRRLQNFLKPKTKLSVEPDWVDKLYLTAYRVDFDAATQTVLLKIASDDTVAKLSANAPADAPYATVTELRAQPAQITCTPHGRTVHGPALLGAGLFLLHGQKLLTIQRDSAAPADNGLLCSAAGRVDALPGQVCYGEAAEEHVLVVRDKSGQLALLGIWDARFFRQPALAAKLRHARDQAVARLRTDGHKKRAAWLAAINRILYVAPRPLPPALRRRFTLQTLITELDDKVVETLPEALVFYDRPVNTLEIRLFCTLDPAADDYELVALFDGDGYGRPVAWRSLTALARVPQQMVAANRELLKIWSRNSKSK